MKRILTIIAIALITASTFTACKKGEDDPSISFTSRVGRLMGKWKLTQKNGTTTATTNVTGTTVSTVTSGSYDGTLETVTITASAVTTLLRYYSFTITFNEKGKFEYEFSIQIPVQPSGTFQTLVYVGSGDWTWNDTDKDKLGLNLSTDYTPVIPDSLNAGTLLPYNISGNYYISRLASDALVLKQNKFGSTQIDTVVVTQANEGQFTFGR